ncbi:hypothetical protein C8Q76DRAFT_241322 [Earliella scabrosa]|nr:hypothetical protein C8Q76DRAFT_241322 [Earliella scabrosa]
MHCPGGVLCSATPRKPNHLRHHRTYVRGPVSRAVYPAHRTRDGTSSERGQHRLSIPEHTRGYPSQRVSVKVKCKCICQNSER